MLQKTLTFLFILSKDWDIKFFLNGTKFLFYHNHSILSMITINYFPKVKRTKITIIKRNQLSWNIISIKMWPWSLKFDPLHTKQLLQEISHFHHIWKVYPISYKFRIKPTLLQFYLILTFQLKTWKIRFLLIHW